MEVACLISETLKRRELGFRSTSPGIHKAWALSPVSHKTGYGGLLLLLWNSASRSWGTWSSGSSSATQPASQPASIDYSRPHLKKKKKKRKKNNIRDFLSLLAAAAWNGNINLRALKALRMESCTEGKVGGRHSTTWGLFYRSAVSPGLILSGL